MLTKNLKLFFIRKMFFKYLAHSDQCIQYFRNRFPESLSYHNTIMILSIFDYRFNTQLSPKYVVYPHLKIYSKPDAKIGGLHKRIWKAEDLVMDHFHCLSSYRPALVE